MDYAMRGTPWLLDHAHTSSLQSAATPYRVPCVTLFVSPRGQASYWRIEVLKERTAGVWKP